MLTEDYLMRYIRLATIALAKILGLRQSGLYQDALFLIDQTVEQLIGVKSDLINSLDDTGILSMLSSQDGIDTDRLTLIADLIKEQGDILAIVEKKTESEWRYLRALNFYLEVYHRGGNLNLPAPDNKIIELAGLILPSKLPPETAFSLFSFFEQTGHLAQASATLTSMVDNLGAVDDLIDEGKRFYHRLLDLPRSELETGGMDISEIKSRLADLEKIG